MFLPEIVKKMLLISSIVHHWQKCVQKPLRFYASARNWISLQVNATTECRPIGPILIHNAQAIVAQIQKAQFRQFQKRIHYAPKQWTMRYRQLDATGR